MKERYPHTVKREKRYKLIACEIMFREVCYLLSQTPNVVDVVFLEKGLHDVGEDKMKAAIQAEIDKVDPQIYDALLLGYGLCNNGVRNLQAKVQMVIPRAHDCITLFLGSKKRYGEYFTANSGTYYKTSGWIERETGFIPQGSIGEKLGYRATYEEYVEEYGEDNAQYIMETLGDWTKNYKKMTYIDMSVGGISLGNAESYRAISKREAKDLGWEYEELKGDLRLIEKLINGDWDEREMLVVPAGNKIIPTNDDDIVRRG
ncbi:MAG: DUF1638 domain-containing protein [Clostridiales bacterium]|jgi:hypothetical protein|nr:DUF1638 domain-containing protein [Clostridiales bacterium]